MGKNKLAKFAEMELLDNVFQPRNEEIFRKEYRLKGRWHESVFGNRNPLVLEIGCGKGEYSVGLGRLFPEKNFIGIDIKGARMWHGATAAKEQHLFNVAFVRMHAEMLESVFAPGEVSEIWITFPDPQMAKARKRLTGTRFLSLYRRMLQAEGLVRLKTDSPFLYTYTAELVRLNGLAVEAQTDDLYGSGLEERILGIKTFYEQQWLGRGKTIKYIAFRLSGREPLLEPEVKIEKDDYHSEARYMGRNHTQE
ncbi:MAG: tRNA (guanosine(46)-N7)-methyltransferase TrmB [Culturomica sp.]|jgi:tRNA (guanine-N7-)-methyltransferase|nr:tRNA (guanosine(46)-N7)-methyltransferase TrmB [Culturomica sp.]